MEGFSGEESAVVHLYLTWTCTKNSCPRLKTVKATGADEVPAKAVRLAAGQIAPSIVYLFNES